MDSLEDPSELVVLTFWEPKEIWISSINLKITCYLVWLKNSNPLLKYYPKE